MPPEFSAGKLQLSPLLNPLHVMTAPNRNPVVEDILTYLLAHTEAEDTVEGIVEWWLLEEGIKNRTKDVQEVLDELVTQSLICERKSEDSRVRYRINVRKLDEIRKLLANRD